MHKMMYLDLQNNGINTHKMILTCRQNNVFLIRIEIMCLKQMKYESESQSWFQK